MRISDAPHDANGYFETRNLKPKEENRKCETEKVGLRGKPGGQFFYM